MAVIIFSIDDTSEENCQNILNVLQRCYSKDAIMVRGCYKGVEEPSFMIEEEAFYAFDVIHGRTEMLHQESVLRVSSCNKMYATLIYADRLGIHKAYIGSMQAVSEEIARSYDAWTHRPDNGTWYICAKRNPDHAGEIRKMGETGGHSDYIDNLDVEHGEYVECVHSDHDNYEVGYRYQVFKNLRGETRVRDDYGFPRLASARFKKIV